MKKLLLTTGLILSINSGLTQTIGIEDITENSQLKNMGVSCYKTDFYGLRGHIVKKVGAINYYKVLANETFLCDKSFEKAKNGLLSYLDLNSKINLVRKFRHSMNENELEELAKLSALLKETIYGNISITEIYKRLGLSEDIIKQYIDLKLDPRLVISAFNKQLMLEIANKIDFPDYGPSLYPKHSPYEVLIGAKTNEGSYIIDVVEIRALNIREDYKPHIAHWFKTGHQPAFNLFNLSKIEITDNIDEIAIFGNENINGSKNKRRFSSVDNFLDIRRTELCPQKPIKSYCAYSAEYKMERSLQEMEIKLQEKLENNLKRSLENR